MSETPPVDDMVIAELQSIMGDDFSLLVQTFENDSADRIVALRAHMDADDADALRQVAHSFKGSAANFGAAQLATLCQTLESMGKSGEIAGASAYLAQLEAEFARVSAALKASLSR